MRIHRQTVIGMNTSLRHIITTTKLTLRKAQPHIHTHKHSDSEANTNKSTKHTDRTKKVGKREAAQTRFSGTYMHHKHQFKQYHHQHTRPHNIETVCVHEGMHSGYSCVCISHTESARAAMCAWSLLDVSYLSVLVHRKKRARHKFLYTSTHMHTNTHAQHTHT